MMDRWINASLFADWTGQSAEPEAPKPAPAAKPLSNGWQQNQMFVSDPEPQPEALEVFPSRNDLVQITRGKHQGKQARVEYVDDGYCRLWVNIGNGQYSPDEIPIADLVVIEQHKGNG